MMGEATLTHDPGYARNGLKPEVSSPDSFENFRTSGADGNRNAPADDDCDVEKDRARAAFLSAESHERLRLAKLLAFGSAAGAAEAGGL